MKGVPAGTVKVWLFRPGKSYSTLAVQLRAKAHSMPPPTSQPLLLLLFETLIELPLVTFAKNVLRTAAQVQFGPARK